MKFLFIALLTISSISSFAAECTVSRLKDTVEGKELFSRIPGALQEKIKNRLASIGLKGDIQLEFKQMKNLTNSMFGAEWIRPRYKVSITLDDGTKLIPGYGYNTRFFSNAYSWNEYEANGNILATHCKLSIVTNRTCFVNSETGVNVMCIALGESTLLN